MDFDSETREYNRVINSQYEWTRFRPTVGFERYVMGRYEPEVTVFTIIVPYNIARVKGKRLICVSLGLPEKYCNIVSPESPEKAEVVCQQMIDKCEWDIPVIPKREGDTSEIFLDEEGFNVVLDHWLKNVDTDIFDELPDDLKDFICDKIDSM